jgi:hypothetical protein
LLLPWAGGKNNKYDGFEIAGSGSARYFRKNF